MSWKVEHILRRVSVLLIWWETLYLENKLTSYTCLYVLFYMNVQQNRSLVLFLPQRLATNKDGEYVLKSSILYADILQVGAECLIVLIITALCGVSDIISDLPVLLARHSRLGVPGHSVPHAGEAQQTCRVVVSSRAE